MAILRAREEVDAEDAEDGHEEDGHEQHVAEAVEGEQDGVYLGEN